MEICAYDTMVRGVRVEKAGQSQGFGHGDAGDKNRLAWVRGIAAALAAGAGHERPQKAGEG